MDRHSPVPKAAEDGREFMASWIRERVDAIPPPPEFVYHYTDVRALMSIFTTKQFWATNAVYTNDQTEILHSLLQLKRLVEEEPVDRDMDPAADSMLRVAEDFYTIVEAYLVCFCNDGDLLSQWRGYGQQGGYALGIETKGLADLLRSGRVLLMPIIYNLAEQDRLIRDLVNRWRTVFKDIPAEVDGNQLRRIGAFVFAQCFAMLAVCFKSEAFQEEKEWRLVYRRQVTLPDDGSGLIVGFRDRNSMITPYVAMNAADESSARLPVRRIVVGPTK